MIAVESLEIIRGNRKIFKETYYIYGKCKRMDRGLWVFLIPLDGKLIAKADYIMLDNNNTKMYINFFAKMYKKR